MEGLRISAVEHMAEAEIALGRPDRAVARLREVAAAHPLWEGSEAKLMRATCHSGREADALALCGDTRQPFVEEPGTEPGAELGALQQAMLRRERIPGLPERAGTVRRAVVPHAGEAVHASEPARPPCACRVSRPASAGAWRASVRRRRFPSRRR